MSNPFVSSRRLFATPSPKHTTHSPKTRRPAQPVAQTAPTIPVRVAQWSWCPHVAPCDFCEGHGFVKGRICPDCEKRGVRWLGTLPLEMCGAGYLAQDGACYYRGAGLTCGFKINEAQVLAAMWHVCASHRKRGGLGV